jgi:hypothetical protein
MDPIYAAVFFIASCWSLFVFILGMKYGRKIVTPPYLSALPERPLIAKYEKRSAEPPWEDNIWNEAMYGTAKPVGETGERKA